MSNFRLKEKHIMRDVVTGHSFTTLDGCLYRSDNEGTTWDKVANADEWSIAKDTKGNIHWTYPDKEKSSQYPEPR